MNLVWVVPLFAGEECQNRIEIDACKAGCRLAGGVCGGLCNFTSGACWVGCQAAFGTCDLGCEACDVGCDGCCPLPDFICHCGDCRRGCNNCRSSCAGARSRCESGCRLDCDACVLDCETGCESICRPFRKVGDHCIPLIDRCAEDLVCWPIPFPGEARPRCFPPESDELYPDDQCRSLYSREVHELAVDTGVTLSFGIGSGAAAVLGFSQELGTIYGPDGRFGCFVSACLGGSVNVEISTYASAGFHRSYDDFSGRGVTIVEGVGELISFVTSQSLNLDGELVGTADCISLGVGLLPISIGVYDCTTIVDTVGMRRSSDGALVAVLNSPPVAVCDHQAVCANPAGCTANVVLDAGSADPEGQSLTLVQTPPGPYGLGTHRITLRATDAGGLSDTCSALVTVTDCAPAEADFNGDGRIDLRDAAALWNCFRGEGVSPEDPACDPVHVDCDIDVDGSDAAHFIAQLGGP
jgi:hypothetical protein